MCAGLATALTRTDADAMRIRLLEGLRRLVPGARLIAVRDWRAGEPRVEPAAAGAIASFEIPTSDPRRIAVLDAVPASSRSFDDWDTQSLACTSHLAALVLEIEALRSAPRAEAPRSRSQSDGAAPLIGSTPAMERLRQTIERVASTDFTVLIEGPIDR